MRVSTLALLRCPFCGTALDLVENQALERTEHEISHAVLGCQCCAFPVVAGIPVLIADDRTRQAMHTMEAGHADEALLTLLGLDDADRRTAFTQILARGDASTCREALAVLSPDAEGTYFIYRFSDPTYLMSQAVLRAVGGTVAPRRVIDVCGGSGHLTRDLLLLPSQPDTLLADVFFWKLWLARTFIARGCEPVCCDGNTPLPFARGGFDMVVLADAFPYIWHKRLLADELVRLVNPGGALVMPHLHSSLGFNYSAGMTLTPAAYASLVGALSPRLYKDSRLLDDLLEGQIVDLAASQTAEAVGEEPSFTLVAGGPAALYTRHETRDPATPAGALAVNPLYDVATVDGRTDLRLTFPTPEYEDEFQACKRYLPAAWSLSGHLRAPVTRESFGADYDELRRRKVVLDVPAGYC